MKIELKEATKQDLPKVIAFIEEFYAIDQYPFDANKISQCLQALIDNNNLGKLWLICEGSRPVGYLVLSLGFSMEYMGRDAFIDDFYIQSADRNKGIGAIVMNQVISIATKMGIKVLHLEVEKHNERAKNLYLKKGFKINQRHLMNKRLVE